jgi:hypothetical protein
MAYNRGTNANIIVGAAALFVSKFNQGIDSTTINTVPSIEGESYKESLSLRYTTKFTNIGYTNNGIELTFTPTFGEVTVDQLLDVAKLYKSGMQVTLKTSFAEATLENLLIAIAQKSGASAGSWNGLNTSTALSTGTATWIDGSALIGVTPTGATNATISGISSTSTNTVAATLASGSYIDIVSGDLGDYPVERSLVAVGPSTATALSTAYPNGVSDQKERIYVAYRAVSITNVTVAAKRDAATMFDVEFRLLPDDSGAYGKIVDRTY